VAFAAGFDCHCDNTELSVPCHHKLNQPAAKPTSQSHHSRTSDILSVNCEYILVLCGLYVTIPAGIYRLLRCRLSMFTKLPTVGALCEQ